MFDLQSAITQAQNVCFLTGAGVSTASGIPDFRSATGIYRHNPEYSLSIDNLRRHPDQFHHFMVDQMYYPQAKPNIIHRVMARISNRKGTIVTQNIDGLDRQAGARNVVEFHGNEYDIYCERCQNSFDLKTYTHQYVHAVDGGTIRPRIVLYGEPIPTLVVEKAIKAVQRADLLVVVGTSLAVYPFASLFQYAQRNATVVIINQTPVPLPRGAHMIAADATRVFDNLTA